ncbi:MEDS domain-containing protein [Halostagnicola sp. A56]|uniref:MEDS domain-containing protein n=1 Tax=Halostagnicola sp. A56 TaxID=1495067 RepID=UPI000679E5B1|nr:MEDS domain-containing protein [Halostagnicola sp. A56]
MGAHIGFATDRTAVSSIFADIVGTRPIRTGCLPEAGQELTMSKIESTTETREPRSADGIEALQAIDDFRGPVESSSHHGSNDHLALVYDSRDEQLQTAIPFVRQGLERCERCLYIVHEHDRAEIESAIERAGIDAEAALESGALTIETAENTYLRNGGFDPDEMLSLLSAEIAEAADAYEGFRVTGEMTWMLDARSRSRTSSSTKPGSIS